MNEFDELRKEVLDSQLAGQSNWTVDTKIAFTLERIKKLKKKAEEFERLCDQMQAKVDKKIERLRDNWRLDETLEEIERLERAVKIAFDVPEGEYGVDLGEESKSAIMKNPFGEET